ncbi:hypothetical protein SAMN06265174_101517 [Dietzia kunjamensis subsp. schimae]|uniref:Uncharacterized protein n=1 Tax=Dietzia kunjamensis subsp. schimae TaxID=498198 RepID=A0ABY1MXQ3_9ACTN|nr:hypothetical protein [Dietzia kunjamensis]SMO41983.1 hypothetical protein SAMN06265174_101517 [Dietzia kunjamensis subsp. schimae]
MSGLFADSKHTVHDRDPDAASTNSRRLLTQLRRRNYAGDASMWWENWVPVAATGWGAVFVIAPLLVADVLIRALGRLAGKNHRPGPPDSNDVA